MLTSLCNGHMTFLVFQTQWPVTILPGSDQVCPEFHCVRSSTTFNQCKTCLLVGQYAQLLLRLVRKQSNIISGTVEALSFKTLPLGSLQAPSLVLLQLAPQHWGPLVPKPKHSLLKARCSEHKLCSLSNNSSLNNNRHRRYSLL